MKQSKKCFALILSAALVCAMVFSGCGQNGANGTTETLKVYNWGEYIADGLLEQFEAETGIKVEYDTFNDNESMYAKVKNSGADSYDVVVPSDYMIKKMIEEDMLAPLNYENIPNIVNLDPVYKNLSYDPEDKYSVPYLVGTVGILYNTDLTGGEITSMRDMFDEKYSRQVCMLYSMRDTIGMTLKMLGYSMNDTDPAHINEARDVLIAQKPHVLAYGTDDLTAKVVNGSAAMSMVYSGEGVTAVEESPENLRFVVPEEGTNLAVDSFVILKTSKHKEAAEKFINFMLDKDVALKNAIETGYSTTNLAAKEALPEDIRNDPGRYPPQEVMERCEIFESSNEPYVEAWNLITAE